MRAILLKSSNTIRIFHYISMDLILTSLVHVLCQISDETIHLATISYQQNIQHSHEIHRLRYIYIYVYIFEKKKHKKILALLTPSKKANIQLAKLIEFLNIAMATVMLMKRQIIKNGARTKNSSNNKKKSPIHRIIQRVLICLFVCICVFVHKQYLRQFN